MRGISRTWREALRSRSQSTKKHPEVCQTKRSPLLLADLQYQVLAPKKSGLFSRWPLRDSDFKFAFWLFLCLSERCSVAPSCPVPEGVSLYQPMKGRPCVLMATGLVRRTLPTSAILGGRNVSRNQHANCYLSCSPSKGKRNKAPPPKKNNRKKTDPTMGTEMQPWYTKWNQQRLSGTSPRRLVWPACGRLEGS